MDISPKPRTDQFLGAANVVVTVEYGDSCPLALGKRYEDWDLGDPTDRSLEEIRPIRKAVRDRGRAAPRRDPPDVSAMMVGMSDTEITAMRGSDWLAVRAIYAAGIVSGNATFETDTPEWDVFDDGHIGDLSLVAVNGDEVIGWGCGGSRLGPLRLRGSSGEQCLC